MARNIFYLFKKKFLKNVLHLFLHCPIIKKLIHGNKWVNVFVNIYD